jgi:hypothetical protein
MPECCKHVAVASSFHFHSVPARTAASQPARAVRAALSTAYLVQHVRLVLVVQRAGAEAACAVTRVTLYNQASARVAVQ